MKIEVKTVVKVSKEKAWDLFTLPEHVVNWNFASDDWCCPWAKNDLSVGGTFTSRMESKDGKHGFDFSGKYTQVDKPNSYTYQLEDGREVMVAFISHESGVEIKEIFDAENENAAELQRQGWQAILENFKKYGESS